MSHGARDSAIDPQWPKLLSLSAHELRSPLSVVAGYVRMLAQQKIGPVSDDQLRILKEVEKSCGRLSAILAELSELAKLESGKAPFNRSTVDMRDILSDAIASLPLHPDRELSARIVGRPPAAVLVKGDAVRLRKAFAAILHALLRELVTGPELAVRISPSSNREPARIDIADPTRLDGTTRLSTEVLVAFDEWRGGTGLALPIARRILNAHGGAIFAPPQDLKAAAVVLIPAGK